jgi:hypothetical protein
MATALQSLRLPYWDAAAVPPVGTGSYPCTYYLVLYYGPELSGRLRERAEEDH